MKKWKKYVLAFAAAFLGFGLAVGADVKAYVEETKYTEDGFRYKYVYGTYDETGETVSDPTIAIIGYEGSEVDVVIPSVINGKPVTHILGDWPNIVHGWPGEDENISSITIPNSVLIIGKYAFRYCGSTKIIIPGSVKSIGLEAFSSCGNLKNVVIGDGVISIGEGAFSNCSSLESVEIPNSVKSIGDGVFSNCESLAGITAESANENFASEDGVLFNKEKTQLISYPGSKDGNYVVPDGVTHIRNKAFEYCNNLTSIIIPNSVIDIGSSAFRGGSQGNGDSLDIFYMGTENDFKEINFAESEATYIAVHYNSIMPHQITLNESSIDMVVGNTQYVSAFVMPISNDTIKNVIYSSSDANIAECSNNGLILAKAPGIATITAETVNGITAFCIVNVIGAPTGYDISNPRIEKQITTWDCVWFGNYWQNDTNKDGKADVKDTKEPIKWRVLSVNGDDAFLVAEKSLDCQQYHETEWGITWKISSLRNWLNNDFYKNAFSVNEQEGINTWVVLNESVQDFPDLTGPGTADSMWAGNDTEDKVYLLSEYELRQEKYGFIYDSSSYTIKGITTENTAYANDRGSKSTWWWLRNLYGVMGEAITNDGGFADWNADEKFSVRPCLHLKLSSLLWKKAGTVSSSGMVHEIGTQPVASQEEPLGVVTDVVAKSEGYNSNKITWNKNCTVTGYEIYRSVNKNDSYKKIGTVTKNSTTSYIDKKLATGKTYYYKIRAYKKSGNTSQYSDYSKVVSAKPVLAKTTIISVKNAGAKKLTVKWKKVEGANGYEIYRSTSKKGKYSKVKTITNSKF